LILQGHKNGWWLDNKGSLGGITYFDKVIQVLNRPKSNPVRAYNTQTRNVEKIEVFNDLCYTDIQMSEAVMSVHNITNLMLKDAISYFHQFILYLTGEKNY